MKNLFLFIIVLSAFLISSCCHKKEIIKQQSTSNENKIQIDDYLKFEADYYHTTEASYEEVKIINGKLFYTFFKDSKGDCSQWTEQKPCWTKENLTTKEVSLTKNEIDSLAKKIQQNGFWQLDTLIGTPTESQPYYTFALSFKSVENQKSVLFKSVPGGIIMPNAFRKSRDELNKIVRKKIGAF